MQYRFIRGAELVVTECGHYSSDVIAVEKNNLIEFEVKVSVLDFKADFKKEKHKLYEHNSKRDDWDNNMRFLPHLFYFVVPDSIVAEILPLLIGRPYGVIAVPDIPFKPVMSWIQSNRYLRNVKRATIMRKHPVTEVEKDIVIKRMVSELINAKINKTRK